MEKSQNFEKFKELQGSEKYVAFIDMLGYKYKLQKLERTEIIHFIFKLVSAQASKDVATFMLTDCMYIVGDNLDNVFEAIACLQVLLLRASERDASNDNKLIDINLLRGGITKGNVIFNKELDILLGNAVNRAYFLESEMAIFPRILVDFTCEEENLRHFVRKDIDGLLYFDFIKYYIQRKCGENERNCSKLYSEYIGFMREKGIKSDNLKIVQKYNWFINYLESAK